MRIRATTRQNAAVVLLTLLVAAFYAATLREGHGWGGDFAMYINHAKNIAEGNEYGATGYIYNPSYPSLAPKTYPPVFPLVLSPVYALFGFELRAMKLEIVILFACVLVVLSIIVRQIVAKEYVFPLIAAVGLNPLFWSFKDNVVSDIPFILFLFLTILLHKSCRTQSWRAGVPLGAAMYLGYGTRSIGLVLLPCLLVHDLRRYKRFTPSTLSALAACVILAGFQNALLHSDQSYFDQVRFSYEIIERNIVEYGRWASMFWANGYTDTARKLLFLLSSPLVLTGFVARVMKKDSFIEVCAVAYLLAIVMWPTQQGVRFILPILPLYTMYLFCGLEVLGRLASGSWARPLFSAVLIAIALTYAARYTSVEWGPLKEGIYKIESLELFEYVRTATSDRDVFIFVKPRVLSLMTGRRAAANHRPADHQELWRYFSGIGATYLILGPSNLEPHERAYLSYFAKTEQDKLELVYANADFEVYRIRDVGRGSYSLRVQSVLDADNDSRP